MHRVLHRKQQQEASLESASSAESAPTFSSSSSAPSSLHPFWSSVPADSTPEDDLARKREWRVGAADLERLREFVKMFEGSHNFHNFTVGREFGDRSNLRFMKEIRVCTAFLSSILGFRHRMYSRMRGFTDDYPVPGRRPCCSRQHRMDRCDVARPKFHATPNRESTAALPSISYSTPTMFRGK